MDRRNMNLRTDGFVRNIHSRNPFDVIRADVVLARIEKEAGRCCGMHSHRIFCGNRTSGQRRSAVPHPG